jgi:hypothetical protein
MPRTLTTGVAQDFLHNYRAITDPQSLSYNDNYCGGYLNDKTRDYGFKTWEAMAAACRKLLKINPPTKKGKIRIEIVKYMGKFGAFASGESEMYRAVLIGANGKQQALPDTRACCTEYGGHPERKYAEQIARTWASLLGCKIVSVDKTTGKKAA